MAARDTTKTLTKVAPAEEPAEEVFGQRKRPERGRFCLQVDRQTKGSYTTFDAAEKAGLAIKTAYPIVRVEVYDSVDSVNKTIEPA